MAELLVKDAEKWFRREDGRPFKILDRLSFAAREGCVTVLIGPSGCGKSTLLNSVVGLENLDRGELIFISGGKPETRPLIGYVFQSPRLLPCPAARTRRNSGPPIPENENGWYLRANLADRIAG